MSSLNATATPTRSLPTALLGVLAAALLLLSLLLDLSIMPRDAALGHDFSVFYAAGLTLRQGHDPYNAQQLTATESRLRSIGDPRQPMGVNAYANPPLFAWAMAALTVLPARTAYIVWLAAMVAAMLAAMAVLARAYGVHGRNRAMLLFVATPAPMIAFFLGQQTPLLLLSLAVALAALRRGYPALAGVALSVGWIKPHLLFPVVLVLVAMLCRRDARRALGGFLGACAFLGLASWLATGGALFMAWARDLARFGHSVDTSQPDLSSLAGLYLSVVGRPWSGYLAVAILGLWVLFAAALVRRARREGLTPSDDAWTRLLALALATWLLATPYAHPADLVLLAVALPVLLGPRLEGGVPPLSAWGGEGGLADARVRLALALLLIAPEADLLGFRPNFVLSYSVLVPLALLTALRLRQALPTVSLRAPLRRVTFTTVWRSVLTSRR